MKNIQEKDCVFRVMCKVNDNNLTYPVEMTCQWKHASIANVDMEKIIGRSLTLLISKEKLIGMSEQEVIVELKKKALENLNSCIRKELSRIREITEYLSE